MYEGNLAFSEGLCHQTPEGFIHLFEEATFVQPLIFNRAEQHIKELPLFLQSNPLNKVCMSVYQSVLEQTGLNSNALGILVHLLYRE